MGWNGLKWKPCGSYIHQLNHNHNPHTTPAVYRLLEAAGGLKLLDDPQIHAATQEILPDAGKSRAQVSSKQQEGGRVDVSVC